MFLLRLLFVVLLMVLYSQDTDSYDYIPSWVFDNHSQPSKNLPKPSEATPTATPTGSWVEYQRVYSYSEKCVAIHTARKNWNKAQRICENEGSKLASPRDEDEADMYVQFLSQSVISRLKTGVWLGMRSYDTVGPWTTVQGYNFSKHDVDAWDISYGVSDLEDACIIYNTEEVLLQAVSCFNRFSFLCERYCAFVG